jgi:antitoxin HigA-1
MSAIIGLFMANRASKGTRCFQATRGVPKNGMRPVHPGEILREDYLKPRDMSANALATALKVPASRINDIVLEHRGVAVDTAMCIARYFRGDVQGWMGVARAQKVSTRSLACG